MITVIGSVSQLHQRSEGKVSKTEVFYTTAINNLNLWLTESIQLEKGKHMESMPEIQQPIHHLQFSRNILKMLLCIYFFGLTYIRYTALLYLSSSAYYLLICLTGFSVREGFELSKHAKPHHTYQVLVRS